jgi:SAM-dependent methyltransferase
MAKINNQPLKELIWFEQLERKWRCPHSYTHTWRWWKMDGIKTKLMGKGLERRRGRPIRILSIGCGLGGDLFVLNLLWGKKHCLELTGLDIDSEKIHLLNYFKEKREVKNLTFLLGDAQILPFKEGAFDLVLCNEVLEHLPEPEKAIDEMRRVLVSDGLAIITTPNGSNFLTLVGRLFKRISKPGEVDEEKGEHISVKGWREWVRLFKKAGFSVERVLRGSLIIGGPVSDRFPALFGIILIIESILDLIPMGRDLADQFALVARK